MVSMVEELLAFPGYMVPTTAGKSTMISYSFLYAHDGIHQGC